MEMEGPDYDEELILLGAITILEAALLQAEDEEMAMAMVTGHIGARIMGMLEDGDDLLGMLRLCCSEQFRIIRLF